MILGTSKIWSKSGPGDLLTITKMLQRNTRKIMESTGWQLIESGLAAVHLQKERTESFGRVVKLWQTDVLLTATLPEPTIKHAPKDITSSRQDFPQASKP